MSFFLHEQQYRSSETMSRIANINICICGAGALGANIAENLVRMGFKSFDNSTSINCYRLVNRQKSSLFAHRSRQQLCRNNME